MDINQADFNPAFMDVIQEPVPVETPITEVVTVAPQEPMHMGGPKLADLPPKPKPRRVPKRDY